MMKKTLLCLLALAMLLSLAACVRPVTPAYQEAIEPAALAAYCQAVLPSGDLLADADEDYLRYRMELPEAVAAAAVIRIQNAGTALDEFGVLRAPDGVDAKAVAETIEAYLTARREEWTGMYLVEEFPKLRDAECRVFGRYVVYGILSEEDRGKLFDAAEAHLHK